MKPFLCSSSFGRWLKIIVLKISKTVLTAIKYDQRYDSYLKRPVVPYIMSANSEIKIRNVKTVSLCKT